MTRSNYSETLTNESYFIIHDRSTLICKQQYNKVLLYSTGNYIQYPVINHNGKEYEKEYICITESLCCTAEIKHNIVIQLYFNKIKNKLF